MLLGGDAARGAAEGLKGGTGSALDRGMTTTKKTTKTNNTPAVSAFVCEFCGAFNSGFGGGPGRCGCAKAREARGEKPAVVVDINAIELVF